MSSSSLDRRQFLTRLGLLGLGGLGSVALSGCHTLDRVILGDAKDEAERVVILGSGLAGLMAAYHLKKSNIHFHLYEASPRLGGRVYSVPEFFRGQNVAELGAEFFSADQKLVFELAQELRLEITEIREMDNGLRYRKGLQMAPATEILSGLRRLQRSASQVESTEKLRQRNLREWLRERTQESAFLDLINEWCLERYGTPCENISAEVFAPSFDRGTSPLHLWTESRHRFRAGTSALAQALFDRTSGFQPERSYSFRHRLQAVRKRSRGMDLIFETPSGQKEVFARTVICALPLAVLSEIEGIRDFPGPWQDQSAFQVGSHSKFIYSYPERFWGTQLNQSKLLQFGSGQVVWESSYRLNPLFQFRQGVLSLLWGGPGSRSAGPAQQTGLQRELETLFKKNGEFGIQDQVMMNWSQNPFTKGSVSYPRPGGDPQAWISESEEWFWAGEHTQWQNRGSLQGALESGLKAAQALIAKRPPRFFAV